eukprot:Rmarinus@m.19686
MIPKVEDRLTCPVCLERFQSISEKRPRLLACQHNICSGCLEEVVSNAGLSSCCPLCRQDIAVTLPDLSQIPTNLLIVDILDDLQKEGRSSHCSLCASQPVSCCSSCKIHMCEEHGQAHLSAYNTHKLESYAPEPQSAAERCLSHPDNLCSSICMDCTQLLCSRCVSEEHRDHSCSPIGVAAAAVHGLMNQAALDVNRQISALSNLLPSLTSLEEKVRADAAVTAEGVRIAANTAIQEIEAAKERLLAETDIEADRILKQARHLKESANEAILLARKQTNTAVKLIACENPQGSEMTGPEVVSLLLLRHRLADHAAELTRAHSTVSHIPPACTSKEACVQFNPTGSVNRSIGKLQSMTVPMFSRLPLTSTMPPPLLSWHLEGPPSSTTAGVFSSVVGQLLCLPLRCDRAVLSQKPDIQASISLVSSAAPWAATALTAHASRCDVRVIFLRQGLYSVQFVPLQEGECRVSVLVDGSAAAGSPLQLTVAPRRDYNEATRVRRRVDGKAPSNTSRSLERRTSTPQQSPADGSTVGTVTVGTSATGTTVRFPDPTNHAGGKAEENYAKNRGSPLRRHSAAACVKRSASDSRLPSRRPSGVVVPLSYPEGVATDALGRVYVADQHNNRIVVFDDCGRFVAAIGKTTSPTNASRQREDTTYHVTRPRGLAIDAIGQVVVAEQNSHSLLYF